MIQSSQQNIILDTLFVSLQSPHTEIRAKAAEALGKMGYLVAASQKVESQLLTVLHDPSPIVRQQAVTSLGRVGSKAAIPALLAVLDDPDAAVRESSVVALGVLGSDPVLLLPILQDAVAKARATAARVLGEMDSNNAQVMAGLLQLLGDEDAAVGKDAAIGLSKMDNRRVLPALLKSIEQESAILRCNGAIALGYLGDEAAVAALMSLLQDPVLRVQECAIEALGKIGSQQTTIEPRESYFCLAP
jgi:HEAT repeat protein